MLHYVCMYYRERERYIDSIAVTVPPCPSLDSTQLRLRLVRLAGLALFQQLSDAEQHLWGLPINERSPIAGWFIRENPTKTWMITGGTPIYGNYYMVKSSRHS